MSARARQIRERRLAIAAVAVTILFWSSAFIGIRDAGDELSPGPLSLGRLLVAALVLGLIVGWRRESRPPRGDLGRLLLCGLLWFGAYNVLLNAGEQRVDAGTAAMLVNIGPILIALFAGLFLGEGYPRTLLAGCAVAFAGTVVIALATSNAGVDATWGALLCVGAAFAYAGGVVAQKPLLERTSGLQITFLACVIGVVACLPFAPAMVDEVDSASASAIGWTLYLGVFPTAIGFTTWAYALKRTSAGRMGATTYLVPPTAILLGWAMLDEVPPALALGGGLLCLVGVAITRGARLPRRRRLPAAPAGAAPVARGEEAR